MSEGPTYRISKQTAIPMALHIMDKCDVEEISGDLVCKNCGGKVTIDWFEKKLECNGCDEIW